MDYSQALTWIHSFKANGRRPDLKRVKAILSKIGNPQHQFPAVHVVGTNGKGSTTSFLRHIMTASGYKTGSFTSPYINRFNERIAIDGQDIPDQDLVEVVTSLKPVIEDGEMIDRFGRVTEFELITIMMFYYFASVNPVDIAIIEAGIGGFKDSTNVFTAIAVICPSISLDHQDTLGASISQIAQQKAGVLEEGVPFIFGQMANPVRQIFYNEAYNFDCPTYELGQDFSFMENGRAFDFVSHDFQISSVNLELLGKHQKANASLAIMTSLILSEQFSKISLDTIKKGIYETTWPGRCELVKSNILLDGAHNQDSVEKLVALLKEDFKDKNIQILFAGLARKDLSSMLKTLSDYPLSVTDFSFEQAQSIQDYSLRYSRVKHYQEWLEQAKNHPNDLFVVTGSLYFISEVRHYLFSDK